MDNEYSDVTEGGIITKTFIKIGLAKDEAGANTVMVIFSLVLIVIAIALPFVY